MNENGNKDIIGIWGDIDPTCVLDCLASLSLNYIRKNKKAFLTSYKNTWDLLTSDQKNKSQTYSNNLELQVQEQVLAKSRLVMDTKQVLLFVKKNSYA